MYAKILYHQSLHYSMMLTCHQMTGMITLVAGATMVAVIQVIDAVTVVVTMMTAVKAEIAETTTSADPPEEHCVILIYQNC